MEHLSSLLRHHCATTAHPLPADGPGIVWIWGHGHIYTRGQDAHTMVLVAVCPTVVAPGLVPLVPGVQWRHYPHRLPGQLLAAMLTHARKASASGATSPIVQPVEQQYHVTQKDGRLCVRVPPQEATAGSVRYQPPQGVPVLLDLHSHHALPAFFSATDNRDDTGLGVSAVIGRIFDQPEIAVRLCCYGHTQRVPALTIFDHLGDCRDTYGDSHAHAHH